MKDYIRMSTDEITDLFSKGCTVNLTGSDLVCIFRSIQYFIEDAPRTKEGQELKRRLLDEVVNPLENKVLKALKPAQNILTSKILKKDIRELEPMPAMTYKCLKDLRIQTIGELVSLSEEEIKERLGNRQYKTKKFFIKSIEDSLARLGLSLKDVQNTLEEP